MALVVKSWQFNAQQPVDDQGNHVLIVCRQEGLLAYLLTYLKIDPTTTFKLNKRRIEFVQASLMGYRHRIIPLGSVSSSLYGFAKPWRETAVLIFLSLFVGSGIMALATAFGGVMGSLCGLVIIVAAIAGSLFYYHINKKMHLTVVEVAGFGFGANLVFKRSLIEGQKVEESQVREVCDLTQEFIEAHIIRPPAA